MATLSQLIGAVNGFLAAAGLSTIAKVSIDVALNEIEIKLAAQTELDKVSPILQTYTGYQAVTEGLGWHVSMVTHQGTQPTTGYNFRCFFEGVLQ